MRPCKVPSGPGRRTGWSGLRHPGEGQRRTLAGLQLPSGCLPPAQWPWGREAARPAPPQPTRVGGGAQGSFLTQRGWRSQAGGSAGWVPPPARPAEGRAGWRLAGQAWAGSGRQREQSQPCSASREQRGVAQPRQQAAPCRPPAQPAPADPSPRPSAWPRPGLPGLGRQGARSPRPGCTAGPVLPGEGPFGWAADSNPGLEAASLCPSLWSTVFSTSWSSHEGSAESLPPEVLKVPVLAEDRD